MQETWSSGLVRDGQKAMRNGHRYLRSSNEANGQSDGCWAYKPIAPSAVNVFPDEIEAEEAKRLPEGARVNDITKSKGKKWPAPRDNVIFELGLFMGRLGKARAILMEPRDVGVKLPSDMAGVTTIPYRYAKGPDAAALMGPACNSLREHIMRLGPNN
jgi:Predicted nucleotide-binding protein containing TIR-like domain